MIIFLFVLLLILAYAYSFFMIDNYLQFLNFGRSKICYNTNFLPKSIFHFRQKFFSIFIAVYLKVYD